VPFLTDGRGAGATAKKIFEILKKGCGGFGALLAAHANNGANAGFGYLNANNRSSNSNANSGFRLYRYGLMVLNKDIKRLRPPRPCLTEATGTAGSWQNNIWFLSV
jgi:hypothetical protein